MITENAKCFFKSVVIFFRNSKKTILTIIVVATITLVLTTSVSMFLNKTTNLRFPSIGTIYTIGVKAYWDEALENETREVSWGTVHVGSSTSVTLYVKSISNVKTILELSSGNWVFLNSSDMIVYGPNNDNPYINLTCDYNNTVLNIGESIPIKLTLTIAESPTFVEFLINNDIKKFTFEINISAVEE